MNILLRNPSGVINTPGFPQGYTDNSIRHCYWKLIAPEGKVVRLTFLTFQIHKYDWVEIKDSWNDWYPWIIYRRWPTHSFTVYSTGRVLAVKVHGHEHTGLSSPGFIANYTMVPAGGMHSHVTLLWYP